MSVSARVRSVLGGCRRDVTLALPVTAEGRCVGCEWGDMALCVRRLRGAPGLGSRWRSGIRNAGGAAGRLRARDAILYRELRPCPRITAAPRRPSPSPSPALSTHIRPIDSRVRLSTQERDKALEALRDFLMPKLPPQPLPGYLTCAKPSSVQPTDPPESWHLSSSQLDCFRSLFEPGVCRSPFQATGLPVTPIQKGLLAFTPSKRVGAGQVPGGDKSDMEQHLALMFEKLRDELPNFLWKPANYSLYRKDMEFVSSMLHLHLRGVVKYQVFLTITRLLLLCYFTNSRISVLKLTSHPENNTIQARWSFTGLPLHALFLYLFRSEKSELYRTYDAFSTFQLAPDGLICLHKVERVMPSPPVTVSKKTILVAALIALGLGEDRPALNLLSSSKFPHEL